MTKSKPSSRAPKSDSSSAPAKVATSEASASEAPRKKSNAAKEASASEAPRKKSNADDKEESKAKSQLIDVAASPDESSEPASKRKQKLEFEGSVSRAEAFTQLEAIAEGLEKGKIELQAKGQSVELSPSHHFDLELKASTKGNKERLSIELAWRADCDPEQKLKVIVDSKKK